MPTVVVTSGRSLGQHVVVTTRRFTTDTAPAGFLDALRPMLESVFDVFTEDHWRHALGGWHVVVMDGDEVRAHAAVVERVIEIDGQPFRTGYVEAVAAAVPGGGLGSAVVSDATALIREQFELGALVATRWSFYGRSGWERWQGPAYVRHDGALERSPNDDELVMVLRGGPSAGIDLTTPISCEFRTGGSW